MRHSPHRFEIPRSGIMGVSVRRTSDCLWQFELNSSGCFAKKLIIKQYACARNSFLELNLPISYPSFHRFYFMLYFFINLTFSINCVFYRDFRMHNVFLCSLSGGTPDGLFDIIGNCSAITYDTKTLREDAHCAQEKNGCCHSRAPARVCVRTHTFLPYRIRVSKGPSGGPAENRVAFVLFL